MMEVSFFVDGIPRPQGSKRIFGRGRFTESSEHLQDWRSAVAWRAREKMRSDPPMTRPVKIVVEFRFPRPRNHFIGRNPAKGLRPDAPKFVGKDPDSDKLLRGIFDALTGIVVQDDNLFVEGLWSKVFHETPGVHIWVQEVTEKKAA